MKERSKESKDRKAAAVAEEKSLKEKAAAASRAGVPPRTKGEPLTEVVQDDIERFIDVFNETMARTNAVIPSVVLLSSVAERQLRYLMQRYPMTKLETMVEKAAASTFLNGGGRRAFRADIEWLTREQNFIKVINGKYDDIPVHRRWRDPIAERQTREEEQRRYAREVEREEHERRMREREEWARGAVTYEEYQRMKNNGQLNPIDN